MINFIDCSDDIKNQFMDDIHPFDGGDKSQFLLKVEVEYFIIIDIEIVGEYEDTPFV